MKDIIPQFLDDKLKQKRANTTKFPDDIKQFLVDYSKYYDWNLSDDITLIFKVLKQIDTFLSICEYKDCSNVVKITKEGIVSSGCCHKHTVKISNLKKYGVESNLHIPSVRNKIEEENIKKYGVKNVGAAIPVKEKMKKTMLEKYGVDNIMKNKNYSESQQIKMKKTMLEKYGVEHALHNPILLKKHHLSLFTHKKYKWDTGETSLLQGNEPIVLKELEDKGYTFNDILSDVNDMPEIWYTYNDNKHRYYPDFFIPSENLIIEVKSQWTLDIQLEKNNAKFQAVKDLGYDFKLEVR